MVDRRSPRQASVAQRGATTGRVNTTIVGVMTASLLALTTDSVKSAAIVAVLVFVGFAIVSALIVKAIVTKIVSLLVMAALSLGMFSQRSAVDKCADQVKQGAFSANGNRKTECTFLGFKVRVPTDKLP